MSHKDSFLDPSFSIDFSEPTEAYAFIWELSMEQNAPIPQAVRLPPA